MKKLVSIVIPCYNGADFVGETIQSVLNQTYKNLEILIIDDGSTDDSAVIINSFSDQRIKYIYQANKGLSAARNTGLFKLSGDYVNFLDADDVLLPKKIEDQVAFLEQNSEYGLVTQGFIRTNENSEHLYNSIEPEGEIGLDQIIVKSVFHVPTALIRKEWIQKIGLFDTSLSAAEDWDYYARLAIEGCQMYRQAVANCTYRVLDNAMTMNAPRQTEMLLKVIAKNFSNPKLSPNLYHLQKQANFKVTLMGASRCFALNYFAEGIQYLKQAIKIDAKKVEQLNYERLVNRIAFFSKHMQIPDAKQKASMIIEHGIEEFPFLSKIEKKLDFNIGLMTSSNKIFYLFNQFLIYPFVVIRSIIEVIIFKLWFKE